MLIFIHDFQENLPAYILVTIFLIRHSTAKSEMKFRSKLKHALSRVATVAIVVIIIIIIAAGGYYALTLPKSPTSSSTTTPTSSSSTSGAPPSSAAVDEIPGPVSVDPSSSYDV